jgi:cytochrome c oxidase accessory protein FixG
MVENKIQQVDESFRDSIATITEDGKRAWIYPKKPKGKHYHARTLVSIIFLIIFFTMPLIKINGHPFFLLNVIERKFVLFGIAFFPQDFFLFVLAMITFVVFIALFTALFGRLWCGWTCPQTVFMEMVFRKIEYFIEGDFMQQKALNKREWDAQKIRIKLTKHVVFFILSFIISNTFLMYIIGFDDWKAIVTDSPFNHLGGLTAILLFTGVFYGVYARFREQVCLVVCPYGRLQGVLLDPNSVVIAYDYNRGEPRGKLNKNNAQQGDCIDCHQCVQVCPTGIDIRNGTQLECVNCTACIDACDDIMDKIKKPHGLIRYTSENAIKKGIKFKITPRIIGYSIVLFILFSTLVTLLIMRSDIETTVLRTPGMLYQKQDETHISNLYNIELVNKTFKDIPVEVKVTEPTTGTIKWIGNGIQKLSEQSVAQGTFFLILPKEAIVKTKTKVVFEIVSNGKKIDQYETSFLGPNN